MHAWLDMQERYRDELDAVVKEVRANKTKVKNGETEASSPGSDKANATATPEVSTPVVESSDDTSSEDGDTSMAERVLAEYKRRVKEAEDVVKQRREKLD